MVNTFAHFCLFGLFLGLVTGLKITDEKCSCPPDAVNGTMSYCGHLLSPECFKHRIYKCIDGVGKKFNPCIYVPCVTNHTNSKGEIVPSSCLPRKDIKAYLEEIKAGTKPKCEGCITQHNHTQFTDNEKILVGDTYLKDAFASLNAKIGTATLMKRVGTSDDFEEA